MPSRFYQNVVSRPALSSQVIELPKQTTVVSDSTTTVVDEIPQAVANEPTTTVVVDSSLWKAELNGALFPASRVKPIERAQDALTHAEECVYDFLWGTKNAAKRKLRNNMDNCWKIRFGGEPKSYSSMRDGLCVVGSGSLRVARRSL